MMNGARALPTYSAFQGFDWTELEWLELQTLLPRAARVIGHRSLGVSMPPRRQPRGSLLGRPSRLNETEASPIRYVAELIGADTDSARAIRWLIALMVLCCDPLAIALTAAASARRE